MTAERSARAVRNRARWVVAGAVALAVAGAAAVTFWPHPGRSLRAPADSAPPPPLTTSPFLNTKPGVGYVGDRRCAGCHPDHARSYRRHPMGRSLFTAAASPPLEKYDRTAKNPFRAGPFQFQVLRQGNRLIHREWCEDASGDVVAQVQEEVAYAIGSGAQARSYVYQRDGFLFQSPIAWYPQQSEWGLSPGYEKNLAHFSRRIEARCLYCHSHEAHPVADTVNRYRDPVFGQHAIGCERCHGPGELHAARRREGDPPGDVDYTIVNPRHLAPALREAVCEQCHLQGEASVVPRGRAQADYRPGLPLHEYVSIFVRTPGTVDAGKIVSHVEQMYLSACFRRSDGKFGCTSCHDPHGQPPAKESVTFYRQRCLNCHDSPPRPSAKGGSVRAPACSLPVAERTAKDARDNCVGCHMPRNPSSNATHLAVTDHRVLRHPGRPPEGRPGPGPGGPPLVAFHGHLPSPKEERPRDLGLALISLAMVADSLGAEPIRNYLSRQALPPLDQAVTRAPDDVPALEARAFALFTQDRLDEALELLEAALEQAPHREETLTWAARIADARGRLEQAEAYGRRLAEHYPHAADHRHRLATVLAKRRAWPQALEAARAAVKADPFRPESRALLIAAHLETGKRALAQAEFDTLGAIDPAYQAKLRPWFE
ncbi:MAG: hypothetical protein L0Z62_06645, partial [Gemmataceae bacterium]|nr:hypothetical protein [Gemmataceae bacterium]